jgi:hypothetical protein
MLEFNWGIEMHSSRGRTQRRKPDERSTGNQSSEPDFGILPHNHTDQPASESMGSGKRELRDSERGIGPTLKPHPKRMAMQAAPDHGDHYE